MIKAIQHVWYLTAAISVGICQNAYAQNSGEYEWLCTHQNQCKVAPYFKYEYINNTLQIEIPVRFIFSSGLASYAPGYDPKEFVWNAPRPKSATFSDEQLQFIDQLKKLVANTWGGKFVISGTQKSSGSPKTVEIEVAIKEDLQNYTWTIFVERYPIEWDDYEVTVCRPGETNSLVASRQNAYCNKNAKGDLTGGVNLTQSSLKPSSLLNNYTDAVIDFLTSTSKFKNEPRAKGKLQNAESVLSSMGPQAIIVSSTKKPKGSSRSGVRIARSRIREVTQILIGLGISKDQITPLILDLTPANNVSSYDKVTISIENKPFNTAAHEVGHLLGLEDEYANAAPIKEYNDLIANSGLPPVIQQDGSSIMSHGDQVLKHHYSHFWKILSTLEPSYTWKIEDTP